MQKEGQIKNSKPNSDSTAFSVNFTLNEFNTQSSNVSLNSLKTQELGDQIKFLEYAVYRGDPSDEKFAYQLRKKIIQTSNEPGFGSIKDTLYNKTYGIYFVGSQSKGEINPSEIHGTAGYYITHPIYYSQTPTLSSDLYYASINTTVTTPIEKSVDLKRMVSLVTIRINDIIPNKVDKAVVTYQDYPPGFDLATGTGRPRFREDNYDDVSFTYQINPSDRVKSNFSVNTVVWPYRYFGITINFYDKDGNFIIGKEMPKNDENFFVNINRNTHYIFAGSLFSNPATFNINIDDRWNTPIDVPFNVSHTSHN
ncbi:hypothetical protein AAFN85_31290 [Mucilaginibacter sp. CAU 1740]|uniref:hypothetical protein n=1 Tax=Mucilaginibacter sp. CAU 1740 TaxID=3140365 RepID=UPI00325A901C